eukprot:2888922-Amphidinium_carterae.1
MEAPNPHCCGKLRAYASVSVDQILKYRTTCSIPTLGLWFVACPICFADTLFNPARCGGKQYRLSCSCASCQQNFSAHHVQH